MNPQYSETPGLHLPQPAGVPTPVGGFAMPGQQLPSQNAVPSPAAPPQGVAAPAEAEVSDGEWITRTREIIDRYRTDPFLQAKELGKLKAEYVKARYNKDIKVSQ